MQMLTALKAVLAGWFLKRTVGGLLGILVSLGVPLALVLKMVGLPLLFALAVVGVPMALLLAVVGLPVLLVAALVGVVMAIVVAVAMLGLLLLKIAIPIVIVVLLVRWLFGRRGGKGASGDVKTGPPPETPPADATA
jgi:hypothetical protein